MNYFKKYIRSYFPLKMADFNYVVRTSENISSEYYKKHIIYLDKSGINVGYIEYKPNTGQIWSFYITNDKYRNRGLGSQILNSVMGDIKSYGTKRVWLVTNKYPHPFWEQNGFTYTNPSDFSIKMHSYHRML